MYLRLSWFYVAFFLMIGVHLPFFPVWLSSRGLDPADIGLLTAIGVLAKVTTGPAIAGIADRSGGRRTLILLLSFGSIAAFGLLYGMHGFWGLLIVNTLFMVVWSAKMPLAESLTLLSAGEGRLDYGRVRLWGSLSFILASAASGQILEDRPPMLIYWLLLGGLGLTLAAAWTLPDTRAPRARRGGKPVRKLLTSPAFLLLTVTAAAIQGSHAVYYAFGTLHWQSLGYGNSLIGALWAEGVVAEIILFAVGGKVLARLGPARLLVLGGIAAAVRWPLTGFTDSLSLLVLLQALHAFTYAATHLGTITLIVRTVPADMSATAQSLYSALVMGVGLGLPLYAAGHLYAAFGGGAAYAVMGGLAAVGVACGLWLIRCATKQ